MKIALGNDHCGYVMKAHVMEVLEGLGCEVADFGCPSTEPVDFPDISRAVCVIPSGPGRRNAGFWYAEPVSVQP